MRRRERPFSTKIAGGDRADRVVRVLGSLAVAVLGFFVAAPAASGQSAGATAIDVDGVGPLVTDPVSFRQVETYLAVNPTDPTNMIATALAGSRDGGLAYVTHDGGDSWKRVDGPGDPLFPGGDPMVAFGGDGRAYLATLASGFSVWRSPDGGRSWSGPTGVEGSMDRQWVAASHASGDGDVPVYATARAGEQPQADIAVFVSKDGGRTFSERARISPDSAIINTVTDLTVTREGTVLLPYLFFPIRGRRDIGRGRRGILRSRDGGETWSGPHRAGVQVMSARTGGRSLHTLLGTGGTAVDESGGEFDGTVYMTWNQVVDGHLQPVLARSRDGGRTWSSPVRVNRGGRDSHHSTPHVAVGPEGVVAVSWNDRRHDREDQCYHHYVAISRDGGRSFGSERRISEQETCLPPDYRWQNGGDTQGLVALPDGGFRVVWTGPGPNGARPWTAEVGVN